MSRRFIHLRRLLLAAALMLIAGSVYAQQPAPDPATRPDQQPQVRTPTSAGRPTSTAAQEGFVPVEQLPEPKDRIPAPALVGTAYAFVWLALFTYIWSVWRRLSTVERELEAVSRRVGTGGRPS